MALTSGVLTGERVPRAPMSCGDYSVIDSPSKQLPSPGGPCDLPGRARHLSISSTLASADGYRIAGRAGCPFERHRCKQKGELAYVVRGESFQVKVLKEVDAVLDNHALVSFKEAAVVLAGDGLHRPVVRAHDDDPLGRKPSKGRDPGARPPEW